MFFPHLFSRSSFFSIHSFIHIISLYFLTLAVRQRCGLRNKKGLDGEGPKRGLAYAGESKIVLSPFVYLDSFGVRLSRFPAFPARSRHPPFLSFVSFVLPDF